MIRRGRFEFLQCCLVCLFGVDRVVALVDSAVSASSLLFLLFSLAVAFVEFSDRLVAPFWLSLACDPYAC